MKKHELYQLVNKCKLSNSTLDDAEIIVKFDSLPIPGLFFPSKEEAMDKKVPMTLVRSKEGFIQLKETINGDLYYYYKSRQADKNHKDWLEQISQQMNFKFKSDNNILEIGGGRNVFGIFT
jgi:hypothetical protein